MTRARAAQDAAFKNCCLKSGRFRWKRPRLLLADEIHRGGFGRPVIFDPGYAHRCAGAIDRVSGGGREERIIRGRDEERRPNSRPSNRHRQERGECI